MGPFLDLPRVQSASVGTLLNLWATASRPLYGFIGNMESDQPRSLQVTAMCPRKAGASGSLHRDLWGNKGNGLDLMVSKIKQERRSAFLVSQSLGHILSLPYLVSSSFPRNMKGLALSKGAFFRTSSYLCLEHTFRLRILTAGWVSASTTAQIYLE